MQVEYCVSTRHQTRPGLAPLEALRVPTHLGPNKMRRSAVPGLRASPSRSGTAATDDRAKGPRCGGERLCEAPARCPGAGVGGMRRGAARGGAGRAGPPRGGRPGEGAGGGKLRHARRCRGRQTPVRALREPLHGAVEGGRGAEARWGGPRGGAWGSAACGGRRGGRSGGGRAGGRRRRRAKVARHRPLCPGPGTALCT